MNAPCICPTCGHDLDGGEPLHIDFEGNVAVRGQEVALMTGKETELLECLFERRPRPVTKENLLAYLYSHLSDDTPELKIIDVYVCNLRKKITPLGLDIKTIWGEGYALQIKDTDNEVLEGLGAEAQDEVAAA